MNATVTPELSIGGFLAEVANYSVKSWAKSRHPTQPNDSIRNTKYLSNGASEFLKQQNKERCFSKALAAWLQENRGVQQQVRRAPHRLCEGPKRVVQVAHVGDNIVSGAPVVAHTTTQEYD